MNCFALNCYSVSQKEGLKGDICVSGVDYDSHRILMLQMINCARFVGDTIQI